MFRDRNTSFNEIDYSILIVSICMRKSIKNTKNEMMVNIELSCMLKGYGNPDDYYVLYERS